MKIIVNLKNVREKSIFSLCKTQRAAIIALCVFLTAIGCNNKTEKTETPISVKTLKISAADVKNGARFSGVIAAENDIALAFLSAGQVKTVNVHNGSHVSKGAILAVIDSTATQSVFNAAKAKLDQALDAYKRYQPLHADGNMSEVDWKKVVTAREEAESAFALAQRTLENCSLTAPKDGYISEKKIESGDTVAAGIPVMRLVSIDKLYGEISVPSKDAQNIHEGMNSIVRVDGVNDMYGKVQEIDITANALTRTYKVRVLIESPEGNILPGMLCSVFIADNASPEPSAGFVIPAESLQLGADGRYFVYVVNTESNRVQRAPVDTHGFEENGVVVSNGLKDGDIIVIDGAQKLDEGVLVKIE
ncbi:MAG: efflux RND transporter periplasmic adaptor subunit [Spirochaetaceae bacterium]|jgi:RND family efflux transporter MFP subunit|nr:efflux RND transporter periplasmic adaptor subunit [Spirochaetaceae bacterium]